MQKAGRKEHARTKGNKWKVLKFVYKPRMFSITWLELVGLTVNESCPLTLRSNADPTRVSVKILRIGGMVSGTVEQLVLLQKVF